MSFLGPEWLVRHVELIALITSITVVVILAEILHRKIIFPLSDRLRARAREKITTNVQGKHSHVLSKYLSEGLATIVFIIYCYFGAEILSEYIFGPILEALHSVLILVIIGIFLGISYIINTPRIRHIFFTVEER
jgi:hypothetical protein